MSASERLRVLQTSPAYIVREELERILPQIRAIVEAAERLPEFFQVDGYSHSFVPLLDELDKALS